MRRPEQSGVWRPYHGAVNHVRRRARTGIALAVLGVLGWLGGCSDSPGGPACCDPPRNPPQPLIVSDPVAAATPALGTAPAVALAASAEDEVVYVSLPPGTISSPGVKAVVRRVGSTDSLSPLLLDGGFDPVPVAAQVGDSIEVVVTDREGTRVQVFGLAVLAARPPIVVRTQPPRRKTGVPLNAAMVVVFSEPVDGATLSSTSIQLRQGTSAVAGTVRFLDASLGATQLSAEFVPDAPLGPGTSYQLIVTRQVRDLDGSPLATPDTVPFTTGSVSTGAPASISFSVDTFFTLVIGTTFQMTATVRDAAGTILTDHPVTWSSSNPNIFTVSATGLVTGVALGGGRLTARVDGVSNSIAVVVTVGAPASVTIEPSPAAVAAFDTVLLTATVRDAEGRVNPYPSSVTWTSSDSSVATEAGLAHYSLGVAYGHVIGIKAGEATITATMGSASSTVRVTVGPPVPVAKVILNIDSMTLAKEGAIYLDVRLEDARGRDLSGRGIAISWVSDNPSVATVDSAERFNPLAGSGLVTAVGAGQTRVIATSQSVSDTTAITVTQLGFMAISAGEEHACGLTTAGTAYCWGERDAIAIGDVRTPYCSVAEEGSGSNCTNRPTGPVIGGLTFVDVEAGLYNTCGMREDGSVYCWGSAPILMAGGPFAAVRDGNAACFLTPAGTLSCSTLPTGVTFTAFSYRNAISIGAHMCGVTADGRMYCKGNNDYGQLGDGTTTSATEFVAVSGGLSFAAVSVGVAYTCGLTTIGAVYCWGRNSGGNTMFGVLGIGTSTGPEACSPPFELPPVGCSRVPVAVSGGLTFTSLSAGYSHTCGITTTGAAYCWGHFLAQFGGSSAPSAVPPPADSGSALSFTSLSGGLGSTCGMATNGLAYCWGLNRNGMLGGGSDSTHSGVPLKVKGQP